MGGFQNGRVAQGAFGGNAHQTIRNLADAVFELGLLGLPSATTQAVKQPFLMAVAAEKFDVFNRQVQLGVFRIFQRHAGVRRTQSGDGFQPQIAAYAVFNMHDQIAGG